MAQRIKGQEVELGFVDPQGNDEPIGDVASFEAELDIEILQEGYLGETSDRYDDLFHGVSGTAELHLETARLFAFSELVERRSKRRDPASGRFNASASFQFPNGTLVRISFEDIFFGPFPIRTPARGEYVTTTVQWKCSNIRRIL